MNFITDSDLYDAMGNLTSKDEIDAMRDLLRERDVRTSEQFAVFLAKISPKEWSALVADAVLKVETEEND